MENCKELFTEMLVVLREHNASGKSVTPDQLRKSRDIALNALNALGDGAPVPEDIFEGLSEKERHLVLESFASVIFNSANIRLSNMQGQAPGTDTSEIKFTV